MRLAVLSDIHANLAALDAVSDALGPVDELWVLGDIVGYGPQPNEVIRRLQELGARAVTGNHDGAAIGQLGGGRLRIVDPGLSALGGHRFVIVPKERATDARFPRRAGEPGRRPLG